MRPVPVLHGFRPAFILAAFAPCAGWVADTVGIPSCDDFPQAYAQYAASPGIPDAVCPSILKGVETMCSSFRDGTANDRVYCTIAGQYLYQPAEVLTHLHSGCPLDVRRQAPGQDFRKPVLQVHAAASRTRCSPASLLAAVTELSGNNEALLATPGHFHPQAG